MKTLTRFFGRAAGSFGGAGHFHEGRCAQMSLNPAPALGDGVWM